MRKCIHKLNIGFEPTFGNNVDYSTIIKFRDGNEVKNNFNDDLDHTIWRTWNNMGIYYGDSIRRSQPISVNNSNENSTPGHKNQFIKIGFEIESDSSTFECPSILGRFNTNKPFEFFKAFKKLTDAFAKEGYKPSSAYDEIENEGGGHIHISTKEIDKKGKDFKRLFLRNLYNFSINNPELNWVFNGPWDVDNANSLLSYSNEVSVYCVRTGEFLKTKKVDYNNLIDYYEEDEIYKEFPIINREDMKTIEFRFLMMPRDVKELELHYDLVISIYNYIWKLTVKNKLINNKYKSLSEIKKISKTKTKKNIIQTFNDLKLSNIHIESMKKRKFPFLDIRYDYDLLT